MDLSQVKLVVADMDGTLLNSNHEVSAAFFNLFNEMKVHNILFVAASGRPYYSLIEKLNPIKNDIIFVAENGGYAKDKDQLLLSTPLREEGLDAIIKLLDGIEEAHPVFCTAERAYVKSKSKPLMDLLSEYYSNYEVIDSKEVIKEDILKVAIYHETDAETGIYPKVKHLQSQFSVKVTAQHWVDISEHLANKGHAISLIQDKFGISKAETMAFGDYNNDLELLERAHFSFAMKNAHPNVKAIARYETKSNDENGVEYILEQLIAAKSK